MVKRFKFREFALDLGRASVETIYMERPVVGWRDL